MKANKTKCGLRGQVRGRSVIVRRIPEQRQKEEISVQWMDKKRLQRQEGWAYKVRN